MTIDDYISILEEKGYIVFDNIIELKKAVLETSSEDELIQELLKRKFEKDDCGCGN